MGNDNSINLWKLNSKFRNIYQQVTSHKSQKKSKLFQNDKHFQNNSEF